MRSKSFVFYLLFIITTPTYAKVGLCSDIFFERRVDFGMLSKSFGHLRADFVRNGDDYKIFLFSKNNQLGFISFSFTKSFHMARKKWEGQLSITLVETNRNYRKFGVAEALYRLALEEIGESNVQAIVATLEWTNLEKYLKEKNSGSAVPEVAVEQTPHYKIIRKLGFSVVRDILNPRAPRVVVGRD